MSDAPVVNTVLGRIPADSLGLTLSHEHLAMNPGDPTLYGDSIFDDPAKIIQEVARFTAKGGRTFVEMTPLNFGRDVRACREIAVATGLQVICATGFHKEEFIPQWVSEKSSDEIAAILIHEIRQGIDDTGIHPGVIKIGTSYQRITTIEKKVALIACAAQQETGLPISTHCDKGTMALDLCAILSEAGADPGKVILGHVDIPNDVEYLKQICALGFNVQIDHVGRDKVNRDIVKINLIKTLIGCGFIDQIFLSGDMGKRIYLNSYGGWPGFGYILDEFKGYLLENGVGEEAFEHILIKNPGRAFGIKGD